MYATSLYKPDTLSRLAIIAHEKMREVRRSRLMFMRQAVGRFYGHRKIGDKEENKATPFNLLYHAITTYVPNLVFEDPAVKIDTDIVAYAQYASQLLEPAANKLIRNDLKIRYPLRKVVTDSLFLAGFVKTGICDSGQCVYIPDPVAVGRPYWDRIDPDDMVIDPMARDWHEQSFVGNRYRMPTDMLNEMGIIEPDKIKKLQSRYDLSYKSEASSISDGSNNADRATQIVNYVDLVDIYLPHDKIIVTLPYLESGAASEFLRIVEYDGPETGPFHMLGYCYIGDNLLPVAPVGLWYDLHILANRVMRKIARQSDRLKNIMIYDRSAEDDAEEVRDSDDGETVGVENTDSFKTVQLGGVSDDAYEFMGFVKSLFSEQAGNVEQLAGTNSDADTATQAQMLQANSSIRLEDSRSVVYDFLKETLHDVVYFLHTDPLIQMPLVARDPMMGNQQVMYTPEMRKGEWFDYVVKVEPYSMQRKDPEQKAKRLMELATQVLPAAMQAAQMSMQMGVPFDLAGFIDEVAKAQGISDIGKYFRANPQMMQQMMQMQMFPPTAAPKTMQPPGGVRPQQPNPMATAPRPPAGPQQQRNQQAQAGAADSQSNLNNRQLAGVR